MQVTLNANDWHRRLQLWVFKDVERFENLCPYFWLTVFCIFVSPFVAVGRKAQQVSNWAWDGTVWFTSWVLAPHAFASRWIANRYNPDKAWQTQSFVEVWQPDNLVYDNHIMDEYTRAQEAWSERNHWSGKYSLTNAEKKARLFLETWKSNTEEWESKLERIVAQQSELKSQHAESIRQADQAAQDRKEERRLLALKIANTTQKFVKPFMVLVSIPVIAGLLTGGYWVLVNYWASVVIGAVGALTFAAGLAVLYKFGNWFVNDNRVGLAPELSRKIVEWLAQPVGFIEIFILYVKATLSNNCPAIDWESKDA